MPAPWWVLSGMTETQGWFVVVELAVLAVAALRSLLR
jgi:hypothetical protein